MLEEQVLLERDGVRSRRAHVLVHQSQRVPELMENESAVGTCRVRRDADSPERHRVRWIRCRRVRIRPNVAPALQAIFERDGEQCVRARNELERDVGVTAPFWNDLCNLYLLVNMAIQKTIRDNLSDVSVTKLLSLYLLRCSPVHSTRAAWG